VMDDFWDPNSQLREYEQLYKLHKAHKILLFPNPAVAQERNRKRSGSFEASNYIAEGIRVVYDSLEMDIPNLQNQGWMIVDTTEKDIEATVSYILGKINNEEC